MRSPDHNQHLNLGALTLRTPPADARLPNSPRAITVIATGVGRSGTSMVAKVLEALGVPMGKTANLAVHEDQDFLHALLHFDFVHLATLTEARNAAQPRWGFKFPSLQNHILAPQLAKFRNPHLIVVMRDPVAIASRALISDREQSQTIAALSNVSRQLGDLLHLVEHAECPTLLLSYEKFLAFPKPTIKLIAGFCHLTPQPSELEAARLAILPNNPAYIELFHSPHRGHFDGVTDGHAVGWCVGPTANTPVTVELLIDHVPVTTTKADLFRPDLQQAGIGRGTHAFSFNVAGLAIPANTDLSVRVKGERALLPGSPKKMPHV